VPNDKGDDELFEDLDKFFAPIRDVDWDEPDDATTQAPQEAHVEVRAEPAASAPEPTGELPVVAAPEEPDAGDAWYDSGALAPIDELLGEPGPADVDDDVVLVVDEDDDEDEAGQHGLFEEDDDTADDEVDERIVGDAPSDEDLEAATAHFAGSLGDQETYPTEPVDVLGGPDPDRDLLSELGAPKDVEESLLSDLEERSPARTVVVGAEGFSGPSWQEPAAVEVGGELERRGPGPGERDVPAAFLTGVLLAGVALAALWLGSWAFAIVAGIAVLIAQGELFGVMVKHHHQPATLVGLLAGVLMMAGAYFKGEAATPAMFALGVMASFLWYMTVPIEHRTDVMRNIGLTVLNMAWIPLLAGYLIATLKLPDGRALVFSIILLTFLFDTSAFLIGSVSGGGWFPRPLAPNVSPKKSWEGLLGGTLFTVAASLALVTEFVDPFNGKRLDEAIKASKFIKRIMSFYRPFKDKFAEVRITRPNQKYVKVGCALMHTLLQTAEGVRYLADNKLLRQVAECLAQCDPVS
jgi:CDP-diglyceride synthetase